MRELTMESLATLVAEQRPPCVSLYQPTHRTHPENQQDPIRYRNLLRAMQGLLRERYPDSEVDALVSRFEAFARDNEFWNRRTEGLAILASPERFELFELQRPVPERLIVADSFHTKPLIRILQSADRYHLLCLTRREARLYEGNRDALDRVELTDVPATLTDALGEELTEPHHEVRSIPGQAAIHHGGGQRKDEVDIDTERFFRVVDRALLEHHSRPTGLPMMLVALPEHHTPFRKVSRNPHLIAEGIEADPNALDLETLRARAWRKIEPLYLQRLTSLVDRFGAARARQQGSADLSDVARAAAAGRVDTLLVEAERVVPGRMDPATGEIERGDPGGEGVDDLLDDLAEQVLRTKGEVVVVPKERMPTKSGIAATYRF